MNVNITDLDDKFYCTCDNGYKFDSDKYTFKEMLDELDKLGAHKKNIWYRKSINDKYEKYCL